MCKLQRILKSCMISMIDTHINKVLKKTDKDENSCKR